MIRIFLYLIIAVLLIPAGCSGKKGRNKIRVMTLNIRYDNPRDSINAWPNRDEMTAAFIMDEKPDLLGLQEVLWRQFVYLDSALADYTSVGVGRSDGARGGEMNPVFFRNDRFSMARTITFWLSGTPDEPGSMAWGAGLPRIVTWVELVDKINDEHLFFFNTHFAHDSDSARIMSSRMLLNRVAEIAGDFPFVITGDLNMLPSSIGYSVLTGPAESVPLMKDAFEISGNKPEGPLFTFNGFSDTPGRGRIDYIFVRNGMMVHEHKTHEIKENGIYISDHWPVSAVVTYK